MQIGDASSKFNVVVSTMAEAEQLLDQLLKARDDGKTVNVRLFLAASTNLRPSRKPNKTWQILYGIPLPPSQVYRLAAIGTKLGPGSISVLVDDRSQLLAASTFKDLTGFPLHLSVKVDTGYHRAGLPTRSAAFSSLVRAIFELERHEIGVLHGFYSHAGHSYSSDSPTSAMNFLIEEVEGLEKAAIEATSLRPSSGPALRYSLSVGATPSATSVKCLQHKDPPPLAFKLQTIIRRVNQNHSIELHAGVYPFLDMQQLATHAELGEPSLNKLLSTIVALTILVEVASVYEQRSPPEALIAAGTLALGREPCKSYDGWGVVSDWGMKLDAEQSLGLVECGRKVGRISQEHSILTRNPNQENKYADLRVGQKLRIWPNHACVASAGFSYYLVVDSSLSEDWQNKIVDVWVRARGW